MDTISDKLYFKDTETTTHKKEVIRHTEYPLLIIAGSGSGKIIVKYLCGSNEIGRSGGKNGFTGNS